MNKLNERQCLVLIYSLRSLRVLCVSAVSPGHEELTAEAQRTQRLRREKPEIEIRQLTVPRVRYPGRHAVHFEVTIAQNGSVYDSISSKN